MNKARLVVLVLIVLVSFIVTGCLFRSTTSLSIPQYYLEKTVEEEDDEEVVTARIVGAAVNDASTRLEYAEIEGYFYSQDGTLLATGFARTISEDGEPFTLDPGEVWDFTISCPESPSEPPYPSLKILSCTFVKTYPGPPAEAKLVGSAENDGNVTLAFAKLTGHFYNSQGVDTDPLGTASTTDLKVGEVWDYTIYWPHDQVDYVVGGYVEIEDEDDLQAAEVPSAPEEVDYVTAEVGVVRGSTVMP